VATQGLQNASDATLVPAGPDLPVRRGPASQFLARLVRAVVLQAGMLQLVEITG
jgi:hypothetical protein